MTRQRRLIDLSIYLENDVVSDPPAFRPRIEYLTHENTVEQIASFLPGRPSFEHRVHIVRP